MLGFYDTDSGLLLEDYMTSKSSTIVTSDKQLGAKQREYLHSL